MLRYRCLVLDHDDTSVDSTRKVNYPQFRDYLPKLRPHISMDEDTFVRYCCDMGFYEMCSDVLHYTPQEMADHVADWKAYLQTHRAPFFDGIPEISARQKQEGGLVCVISHSFENTIRPLYDYHGVTQPDFIFGADYPREQRKPNPWPLQEIMRRCDLRPEELLVVDDMPLGLDMAEACGVPFAAAAWWGMPDYVREKFVRRDTVILETVAQLNSLLFV